jgi:hypothetical protein
MGISTGRRLGIVIDEPNYGPTQAGSPLGGIGLSGHIAPAVAPNIWCSSVAISNGRSRPVLWLLPITVRWGIGTVHQPGLRAPQRPTHGRSTGWHPDTG